MSDGRVVIDTRLDGSGVQNGLNNLGNLIKPTLKKISGIIAAAFSIKALVDFSKQAIELASDLQEVQNVVDTSFKDMSYKMEQFADTAIEQFGISRLEAKRTGSTFMAMASGMGLAMDSASDMAIALTGLSADMASFYNVRQDVASTALKSIFTGETETLKQFGIVMTEVNLQEFAYQQGINKKIQAMTQAEKVQLRYNYVMQQTQLAQGDFAKTADSWANQTRILSERWKEFMTIMGNGLVQVLAPALKILNTMLGRLIDIGNALATTFGFDIKQSTTNVADTIGNMAEATDEVTEATKDAKKAQDGLLGGYDKLNVIQKDTSESADSMSAITTPVATTTFDTVTGDTSKIEQSSKALDGLKAILEPLSNISLDNLINALKNLKSALSPLVSTLGDGLKWIYDNVLVPLAKWTIEQVLPNFLNLLASGFEVINSAIEVAKPALSWIWDNFLNPVAGFVGDVFINFLQNFATDLKALANNKDAITFLELLAGAILAYKAGGLIATTLQNLSTSLNNLSTLGKVGVTLAVAVTGWEIGTTIWEYLTGEESPSFSESVSLIMESIETGEFWDAWNAMWDESFSALRSLWKDYVKPWIVDLFEPLISWLKKYVSDPVVKFFKGVWTTIKSIFSSVGTWFKNKFTAGYNGIKSAFTSVGTFFTSVWTTIKNVFKNIGTWFKNKFTTAWTNIKSAFTRVGSFFTSVWTTIKNVFKNVGSWFATIFSTAWGNIKSAFTNVGSFFTSVWTTIKNVFKNVGSWFGNQFKSVWNNITNAFKAGGKIFDGFTTSLADIFKNVVNTLITGINAVVGAPFKAINKLLNKIRNTEILGLTPFDGLWDKDPLPVPQIPKLAKGAVLPPNREFLAVLGDQRHGTNVEAPLDTIKQAVREELRTTNQAPTTINVQFGQKTIAQIVWDEENKMYKQTGKYRPATI